MSFLEQLLPHGSIASGLVILSIAVVFGLALGSIRIRGVSLGVAAVLFSALAMGAMGFTIADDVLGFLRDFALILFVYALGLQVGPGFIASLKSEGVRLNFIAAFVTIGGAIATAVIVLIAKLPHESAPGMYSGAFASTPALAAGEQALNDRLRTRGVAPDDRSQMVKTASLAYAVTYPFGMLGPILLIIVFRRMFRVDIAAERRAILLGRTRDRPRIAFVDIKILDGSFVGTSLNDHPELRDHGIVFSRLVRATEMTVPTGQTRIESGDVVRAVGPRPALAALVRRAGRLSRGTIDRMSSSVDREQVVVTRNSVLGHTVRELGLSKRHGVTVARISRSGVEFPASATLPLKFGDQLTVVGTRAGLKAAADELGNSSDVLNRPKLVPIFLGIVLGVIVGSLPLMIPGMSGGVRLGLAGGPMLVAILLSRLGNIGSVVWYMPAAASNFLRDFGLAVFLACVGLASGGDFVNVVASRSGVLFICFGAIVTIVPMFIVGLVARLALKMNFLTLSGLVAGSMTNSASLLFANDLTKCEEPAIAYAAVYPLSTIIPIFAAQVLVQALM